jgi:hypothetical protein
VRTHIVLSDFASVGTEDEVGFERLRQLWDVAHLEVANLDFVDVDVQGTGTGL